MKQLRADLNILMFGAKRCGKSSTLASMVASLERANAAIKIAFANTITRNKLSQKETRLRTVFSDENVKRGFWIDEEEQSTEGVDSFDFLVTWNEHLTITVKCTDIPGEWIKEQPELMTKFIKTADVIIVSIDTPQLMENGMMGKSFNYTRIVNDFIIKSAIDNQDFMKRIIFVPVKCEKYVHAHRMPEVAERIKQAYNDVLHHWKQHNSDVFIVPVETLGNIEFDHFEHKTGEPHKVFYRYIGNNSYAPRWCEQPIIYAIEHVLYNKVPWDGNRK